MTLTLATIFPAIGVILSGAALLTTWIMMRRKAVDVRLGSLEARVHTIEQAVSGVPSREELHGLELALSGISGDLKAMDAKIGSQVDLMTRLDRVVSRHEDHLLQGGN